MEGKTRRDEVCPQLLDLISRDNHQWLQSRSDRDRTSSEERSLELRLGLGLGPPGDTWHRRNGVGSEKQDDRRRSSPVLSLGNTAQKRTAPAPVVGWPPIRSFRKNIAGASSSKATSDSPHSKLDNNNNNLGDYKKSKESEKAVEKINRGEKGLFVKINMEGVPIGRKVDLKAYDNYQKLASAVDILFRGLLAAQRDSSGSGIQKREEEEKAITGLLDGSGEYTLVYEDNEGDRMLVGDVPWNMFVSTVKRLRVLKSSELSALNLVSGTGKQDQMLLGSSLK